MRSGPTVGDAAENVGDARVHQQVWGVAGVVGQGLDGHQVSRRDGQHGLQSRVEVAPVHGRRRRGQPVDGGGCGMAEHHRTIMPVGRVVVFLTKHTRQQIYYCQPQIKSRQMELKR